MEKAQAAKAFALNLEDDFASEVILLVVSEPSYNQAMKSPERPLWRKPVESEYLSLTNNETWKLVPYLGTMKVIGSMWKFKLKRDSTGNITKYKALLVARGNEQEPDWNSVFAPTVRYTSLRVILAIACINDWKIEQMDVVSAFLHANAESEIYMEQPQGYIAYGDKGQPLVCHLKKALYGIREETKGLERTIHRLAGRLRLCPAPGRSWRVRLQAWEPPIHRRLIHGRLHPHRQQKRLHTNL